MLDGPSAAISLTELAEMMKYEYVPEFQSALYAPAPLQSMLDSD
jgi:hypothetical protein